MRSEATTVHEYLDQLPNDRRVALEAVRETILANLPDGLEEVMNWGMITYQVPLDVYPDTYNGKPLMYAALASQKHHMAVYLTSVYSMPGLLERFQADYRATGKPLDMGKSCVRFKHLEDVPRDVLGQAIGAVSMDQFVEHTKSVTSPRRGAGKRT
jgi:uncharacterized protein YdhG (YjbR/CyaY superfamily)